MEIEEIGPVFLDYDYAQRATTAVFLAPYEPILLFVPANALLSYGGPLFI